MQKNAPGDDRSGVGSGEAFLPGIQMTEVSSGYLYQFSRMDFQQTGKQDDAGRFERGYLKT